MQLNLIECNNVKRQKLECTLRFILKWKFAGQFNINLSFLTLLVQMERQRQRQSPITELIRNSVEKVGVVLAPEKRRVSRQILTDMNIAQLQVIVNDLHSHIELLNEGLVKHLLERDELHMSQDSMLVDIEDMTKYL